MAQTSPPDQTGPVSPPPIRWPLWVALVCIGLVWIAGAAWSFEEQTEFARSKDFHLPQLLPTVIDGFAFAMAAVAWAASLDGRSAVFARFGVGLAIASSAASNGAWAWERSAGDRLAVILAAGVPIVANIAFEVLLSESRRQVQRRRGVPAPEPLPWPRAVRWFLSPWRTWVVWRREVLAATDPAAAFASVRAARPARPARSSRVAQPDPASPDQTDQPDRTISSPTGPVQPGPDQPGTARTATVTPITRPVHRHRPGPVWTRGATAAEDARVLLDRYPDRTPGCNEVMRDLGWGAAKASNALRQLPTVRSDRTIQPDDDAREVTA